MKKILIGLFIFTFANILSGCFTEEINTQISITEDGVQHKTTSIIAVQTATIWLLRNNSLFLSEEASEDLKHTMNRIHEEQRREYKSLLKGIKTNVECFNDCKTGRIVLTIEDNRRLSELYNYDETDTASKMTQIPIEFYNMVPVFLVNVPKIKKFLFLTDLHFVRLKKSEIDHLGGVLGITTKGRVEIRVSPPCYVHPKEHTAHNYKQIEEISVYQWRWENNQPKKDAKLLFRCEV